MSVRRTLQISIIIKAENVKTPADYVALGITLELHYVQNLVKNKDSR